MIENNILAISNVIFKNKSLWKDVTTEQKEQFFFIFNRFFSKKYPHQSLLLNNKNTNKEVGMDIWFEFMKNKPYPQWFWSKPNLKKTNGDINDKDYDLLLKHIDIKSDELNFLIKHHKNELIEELDYLKKLSK